MTRIRVKVPISIEIDTEEWAEEYSLGHATAREIREDVRTSIINLVAGWKVLSELGATLNGAPLGETRPNREESTTQPFMITDDACMTYVVVNSRRLTFRLDHRATSALDQGTLTVRVLREPLPGAVFRVDGNGRWTQRQGPCEYPGHATDGQLTGREFVDYCTVDPLATCDQVEYHTMIVCRKCRERQ